MTQFRFFLFFIVLVALAFGGSISAHGQNENNGNNNNGNNDEPLFEGETAAGWSVTVTDRPPRLVITPIDPETGDFLRPIPIKISGRPKAERLARRLRMHVDAPALVVPDDTWLRRNGEIARERNHDKDAGESDDNDEGENDNNENDEGENDDNDEGDKIRETWTTEPFDIPGRGVMVVCTDFQLERCVEQVNDDQVEDSWIVTVFVVVKVMDEDRNITDTITMIAEGFPVELPSLPGDE